MVISTPTEIKSLDGYLEVQRKHYDACIESIDHALEIDGFDATLRFKYLRFDGNGQPKFDTLAQILSNYLSYYCFSIKKTNGRGEKSMYESNRLQQEARDLLRKCDTSGEAGEILLYFLIETVLKAPQMVAKIDLKTNPKKETLGSDGIHMRWNQADNILDIYFGEAKLYGSIYDALDDVFISLKNFHEDSMKDHEIKLVTSHYKWADSQLKDAVLKHINPQEPGGDCRINHACLIGYDWNEYTELLKNPRTIVEDFKTAYEADTIRLRDLLQKRFDNFQYAQFLYQVFFLPFKSVQEFRDRFSIAAGIK